MRSEIKLGGNDSKDKVRMLSSQYGYLWIGNEKVCFGYIDKMKDIRRLRNYCEQIIKERGRKK